MEDALRAYVGTAILQQYEHFDSGHDGRHVATVMESCARLAAEYGADARMLYVIAAYHDVGLAGGRETHHLTSARILREDARLRQWFTEEQIEIMGQAVEDHRASAQSEPRSLYGRIIADADRELEMDRLLYRTLAYGLERFPQLSEEEQLRRAYDYLQTKYGAHGYMTFKLPASACNQERLDALRALLDRVPEFMALARAQYRQLVGIR